MGWIFAENVMKHTGWTSTIVTVLLTLGVIFMRSKIASPIKVIEETSPELKSKLAQETYLVK